MLSGTIKSWPFEACKSTNPSTKTYLANKEMKLLVSKCMIVYCSYSKPQFDKNLKTDVIF